MDIHSLYRPFLGYHRRKRLKLLFTTLGITQETRVLDIGGNPFFWQLAAEMSLPVPKVTSLNLYSDTAAFREGITWIVGDGRRLPFVDKSFDVAFCNSVIEHMGTWGSQQDLASEIRRVAIRYFVQTPNRWFPVEPHLLTPFVHWVPRWLQRLMLRNFTIRGLIERPSRLQCDAFLQEVRLLDGKEMQSLFPTGKMLFERFCGLTKSIAIVGERSAR